MQVSSAKKFSLKERIKSFHYAFNGIAVVFRSQYNFLIHLSVLSFVVFAGFFFQISPVEWCMLLLASALVLSLEIVNTAMEFLVDFVSPEYHEKAGIIKDLSAAAVLIASGFAVITGLIIFVPYVWAWAAPSSALK